MKKSITLYTIGMLLAASSATFGMDEATTANGEHNTPLAMVSCNSPRNSPHDSLYNSPSGSPRSPRTYIPQSEMTEEQKVEQRKRIAKNVEPLVKQLAESDAALAALQILRAPSPRPGSPTPDNQQNTPSALSQPNDAEIPTLKILYADGTSYEYLTPPHNPREETPITDIFTKMPSNEILKTLLNETQQPNQIIAPETDTLKKRSSSETLTKTSSNEKIEKKVDKVLEEIVKEQAIITPADKKTFLQQYRNEIVITFVAFLALVYCINHYLPAASLDLL